MKSCVSDDTLLRCYLDDAPASVRLHVASCSSCASRYQRLSHTLANAEQELQSGCPPRVSTQRASALRWWVPVTAAVVVLIAVLWRIAVQPPLEPPAHTRRSDPEIERFFTEVVAPALSATSKQRLNPIPAQVSSTGYVHAALTGGWPCEQASAFAPPQCEIAPFFFFFTD